MKTSIAAQLIVVVSLLAPTAFAADTGRAEALFEEAKQLMRAEDYERACPKLEQSYAEDPGTGTLLVLGLCEERRGALASAWRYYRLAQEEAAKEGQADRVEKAERRLAALDDRLCFLELQVPADVDELAHFQLTLDGASLPRSARQGSVPIEPGTHVLVASAAGRVALRLELRIPSPGEKRSIRIPPLAAEPTPPVAPAAPVAVLLPTPSPLVRHDSAPVAHPAPTTDRPLRTLAFVAGGVGVVALSAGTAFGLRARHIDGDSRRNGHCDAQSGCDRIGLSLNDDARSAATLANVLFASGGVLAASAAVLFVLDATRESQRERATPRFATHVVVSDKLAGISLNGSFD